MPECIERRLAVTGEQRVDDDQMRARRNEIRHRDPARYREQIEARVTRKHGEDIHQHPAEPKDRDRDPEQC